VNHHFRLAVDMTRLQNVINNKKNNFFFRFQSIFHPCAYPSYLVFYSFLKLTQHLFHGLSKIMCSTMTSTSACLSGFLKVNITNTSSTFYKGNYSQLSIGIYNITESIWSECPSTSNAGSSRPETPHAQSST